MEDDLWDLGEGGLSSKDGLFIEGVSLLDLGHAGGPLLLGRHA